MDNSIARKKQLEKNLNYILRCLQKNYRPQKVILFGSLARGKIHKGSDLDLLIVKDTKLSKLQRVNKVLNTCDYDVAFEPLILTPGEIKSRLKWGDFFLKEILKTGKVLYERK